MTDLRDASPDADVHDAESAGSVPVWSPPTRLAKARRRLLRAAPPIAVALLMLAGWLAVSYGLLDEQRRFMLPPPNEVVAVGILDTDNLAEILSGLWSTTRVAVTGLAISVAIGVTWAIAMTQGRWIERSLYPYAVALQTVPTLALVPLIGLWLGFDFWSRVTVCITIALFPIISNTNYGIQSVPSTLHDLFDMRGVGRWQRLVKLELPYALPTMFTGFRIAAGLSVIGAIVGDFFFRQGPAGIGRLLDVYTQTLQTSRLFTAILAAALLGVTVFWILGTLARLATGFWHEAWRR